MYIENISSPKDVKKLSISELTNLAEEIRKVLIKKLSKHGGHLGPNLGIVEATIALHYVFNSPYDKIVYDVSHQSYCHKILTGRKEAFLYEDKYNEVSGYSNPCESEHDFFTIGHTSTSVSLACGLAKSRDLKGDNENIIAVIGDGSLSGGEALEGLDFAGEMDSNFIIVVNDNDMSIAENHGGIYKNLNKLRNTEGRYECNFFKAMGLDYVFVKNGNDIKSLIDAFNSVKDIDHPVVVHICTQKGKGYAHAEANKECWHWCSPFDIATGKPSKDFGDYRNYQSITSDFLLDKIKNDSGVAVITSATPTVMGFTKEKRTIAKSQFIDVGIAEEHAVALASGIAANGGKPVYGVYSSFLQRTYDQLSQDLCINNNSALIIVFNASIYGMNDVTHLGIYDIPMISNIPNLVYLAPTSKEEYIAMLEWGIEQNEYPVAVRVPGNGVISSGKAIKADFSDINKYNVSKWGNKVAVIALGGFYQLGEKVIEELRNKINIDATLINPIYITGTDKDLLNSLKENHDIVITLEDGILDGGFGEKIARFYGASDMKVLNYGLKKEFLDRYAANEILIKNRLTPEQITDDIAQLIKQL